MAGLSLRRGTGCSTCAVVLICALSVMIPEVSSFRFIVGANMGWSPNVNYTFWAQDKHFYNGDWLFFVYDRNAQNVLEVNKTNFETCNTQHPLYNWTRGAGRDVVPLNVTKTYYFVSGNGFCYRGMKVAIRVKNPPPPPSPQDSRSPRAVNPQPTSAPAPAPSPQESSSPEVERRELAPSPSPQGSSSPNFEKTAPPPSPLPQNGSSGGAGKPPPRPSSFSQSSGSPSLLSTIRGQIPLLASFAVAPVWVSFLLVR